MNTYTLHKNFGAIIAAERIRQGLTLQKLGRIADIAHSVIQRIEKGVTRLPELKTVVAIEKALGIEPSCVEVLGEG